MSLNLKGRSSLSIHDFSQRQMLYLFDLSRDLKRAKYAGTERGTLRGKEICLIFERTSTRTGCAFEVAAHDQGAHVTHFDPAGSRIGHKESMKDTARVLGRMFDANEFRGAGQKEVEDLAKYAGFAERFGDAVVQPFARRTARLQSIVHHLGLGSADARARLARRLLMPVSKDTLLRLVRPGRRPSTAPRVVGIEGWAWKRDHRYGTIVCDFERHEVVDVLADREAATVEAWLTDHPGIEIVSRDRGGGYGQAVARVLPEATQVADRWHLMRMRAGPSLTRCGAR